MRFVGIRSWGYDQSRAFLNDVVHTETTHHTTPPSTLNKQSGAAVSCVATNRAGM